MRNPYMKFQNPSMHGSKHMAGIKKHDGRMHGITNQKQSAPPTSGHKKRITQPVYGTFTLSDNIVFLKENC